MKHFSSRGPAFAAFMLLGLTASTLLSGCWEKDKEHDCHAPTGGTCSIAATVVDLSKTTGCGLALHLADSTYVVPTGATWTNFHATVGEHVLVGYSTGKHGKHEDNDDDDQNSCAAGPTVQLGCISANPTATTTATAK